MSARIIVTLTCAYDGEDVDDYNSAMDEAALLVQSAGDDLAASYEHVTALGVEVTG